jgi:mRNA interferase RelE/StbE
VIYAVTLSREARRFYEAAEASLQRKLDRCFDVLKITPRHHPNVKRLKGRLSELYRYRVGDYRVVYQIEDAAVVVAVLTIAHRRDVYE